MTTHHDFVIIGGGNAGISVAARLLRSGERDIAVIEPSLTHYYQPLWTLVGGGRARAEHSARAQSQFMPAGARWYRSWANAVDPESQKISLTDGTELSYRVLIVCPGIQLDWDQIPGLSETLGLDGVSSNYSYDLAPQTWEFIRELQSGTAVFAMPSGPIKCAGAPQKIAYMAADYWRSQSRQNDIRVVLVLPTPAMFGVPVYAKELKRVADGYGIEVRLSSEVVEVDSANREVIVKDLVADTKERLEYDMMHIAPPQSAPDWIKASPLADPNDPRGYVEVNRHTLVHSRFPNIIALGDAGSTPNSKTGAAIRKQAPVAVANAKLALAEKAPNAFYSGYASCPLVTSRNRMLLAEFDYTMEPTPSIPFVDLTKERRDMWYLKKYGLPALYWHAILRGRA